LIERRRKPFAAGKPPQGGTVYLTAADASGMMVSMIQSNYMGFGSGVVVPGIGVIAAEPRRHLRDAGRPPRTASARRRSPTRPSSRAS
jgi:gamma-glutamyltranspeptidase/glutathione hydrolase